MVEIIILFMVALAFDASNGFHDAPNVTAPLVGTKTLNYRLAVAWNVFWTILPAFFVGTAVAKTIGAGLFAQPPSNAVMMAGLVSAFIWNIITWRRGIPSSSSYALIGGLFGAVGMQGVIEAWQKSPDILTSFLMPMAGSARGWEKVLLGMLVAPVLGFLVTRFLMFLLDKKILRITWTGKRIRKFLQPLNRLIVIFFASMDKKILMPFVGRYLSVEHFVWRGMCKLLGRKNPRPRMVFPHKARFVGTGTQYGLLGSSALLSAAHAGNDAMKTAGVMTAILYGAGYIKTFHVPDFVIVLSFVALGFGTALGGKRIEDTLINKLGKMIPARACLAQFMTSMVVREATMQGMPLSTTLVYTSANAGANRYKDNGVWNTAMHICIRWALTIPVTAGISAILIVLIRVLDLAP